MINALVSFGSKQMFSTNNTQVNYANDMPVSPIEQSQGAIAPGKGTVIDSSMISADPNFRKDITQPNLPEITGDVFVKSVNGKVTVNKDGLIESVSFYGVLSGKDAQGVIHDLSVDALIKLENINSTIITKPDLTGKKVVENNDTQIIPETLSSKFEGTYKVDVVKEVSQQFVKIGEKTIVIESIKDGKIAGKYFETYKAGYESYITDTSEFAFESVIDNPYTVQIQFTDKAGKIQNGSLNFDVMNSKINFWLYSFDKSKFADNNFSRVFTD